MPFLEGGEEATTSDSLRARFLSWSIDFNSLQNNYTSLYESWVYGSISDSTFLSTSESYYNQFLSLEQELWEIDDDAVGTEWDSCLQKMVEAVALWNNGVYYARESIRTGDIYYATLATDYFNDSTRKINEATALIPE